MKKTKIIYWIFTILLAAMMLMASIPYIMNTEDTVKLVSGIMGYPKYIIPFLGYAKLLAAIAIMVPGFPRIKEWAYAGIAFDLAGATFSGMMINNPPWMWMWMFLFFIPLIGSYIFYHKMLREKAKMTSV